MTESVTPSGSEALDRLETFLRTRAQDPSTFEIVAHDGIVGGYSRLMSKVWVKDSTGSTAYVVRADPPKGRAFIDTDRTEEWDLLCALASTGTIPMPEPMWCDLTGDELGAPTIISQLIDGPSLLAAAVPLDERERLTIALRFAEIAAAIHDFDLTKLPGHMTPPSSWDAYIDSRAQQWIDTDERHPGLDPFMQLIGRWLRANKPDPVELSLVHGDFQPNNAVVDADGTLRMVDWELAHVGDPREDLGWMNLCGANQPPDLIAADPEAFYARYREICGLPPSAVNAATVAYFTVLGAGTVFLPMVEQLTAFVRREASGVALTYITLGLAGMHNVIMGCMTRHAEQTGAVW